MSTKYAMRHGGGDDEQFPRVTKTIGKKAIHAPLDGECEECGNEFERGDWVLLVTEGNYEHYQHEVCPKQEVASETV